MALPDSYDVSDSFSPDICAIFLHHELNIPGHGYGRIIKASTALRLLGVVGEVTPVFTQQPDGLQVSDPDGNLFFIPWSSIILVVVKSGGVTAEFFAEGADVIDLTVEAE
jgi:hypothetical protein